MSVLAPSKKIVRPRAWWRTAEPPPIPSDEPPPEPPPSEFGGSLPAPLAASQGNGGTVVIAPGGNDTTGTGSEANPYRTPHKAFSVVALTGGLILCRGGTYNLAGTGVGNTGQQQYNRIGSLTNPPQIKAWPGETPVFTNTMWLIGATTTTRGLRVGPGLVLDGGVSNQGDGWDMLRVECSGGNVEVVGCEIAGAPFGNGILVSYVAQTPENVQILDCIFHDNGNPTTSHFHGVYFGYAEAGSLIANCVFYDNAGFSAQFGPACSDLIVTNCTADEQTGSGSLAGGFAIWTQDPEENLRTRMFGCVVANMDYAFGISVSGDIGVGQQVRDPVIYNCPGTIEPHANLTSSNITTANPNFVNEPNRDLRLSAGSSAIDHISEVYYGFVPPTDILGNTRLTGDCGAYAKEATP